MHRRMSNIECPMSNIQVLTSTPIRHYSNLSFNRIFLFLLLFPVFAQSQSPTFAPVKTFHLASPRITTDSILFKENAKLTLSLNHPGVQLFYTDDGTEVSQNSQRYQEAILIGQSTVVQAKAFHPDFLPSETVAQAIYKVNDIAASAQIDLYPAPHENYPGNGSHTLIDLKKGSTNFRTGQYWLGFQSETVTINLRLKNAAEIKSLSLSTLEDNGSWIFLPQSIEVFDGDKRIAKKEWPQPNEAQKKALKFLKLEWPKTRLQNIRIEIKHFSSIPDWHPGKGTPPWLFIDEILID